MAALGCPEFGVSARQARGEASARRGVGRGRVAREGARRPRRAGGVRGRGAAREVARRLRDAVHGCQVCCQNGGVSKDGLCNSPPQLAQHPTPWRPNMKGRATVRTRCDSDCARRGSGRLRALV